MYLNVITFAERQTSRSNDLFDMCMTKCMDCKYREREKKNQSYRLLKTKGQSQRISLVFGTMGWFNFVVIVDIYHKTSV